MGESVGINFKLHICKREGGRDGWMNGGREGDSERERERGRERERVHKRDDAGNCKLPVYSDVVGGRTPPPPAHPPPKVQFHSVPRQGTGPQGAALPPWPGLLPALFCTCSRLLTLYVLSAHC